LVKQRRIVTAVLTGLLSLAQFLAPHPAAAADPVAPVQKIVDIPSHRAHGLIQSDIYHIKAGAGPLRIVLSDLLADAEVRVVLESTETGEALLDEVVTADMSALERNVPADTYSLAVVPNMAGAVTLHGMDLEVSTAIPGIRFPEMEAFATRNERFSLSLELENGLTL
jgi:hypothetical protein